MCDFDEWFTDLVKLHQTDEAEFNVRRIAILEERISDICVTDCSAERCRKLIWRMDSDLQKYKDPVARYNALVGMFYEQLDTIQHPALPSDKDNVLPFKPNK